MAREFDGVFLENSSVSEGATPIKKDRVRYGVLSGEKAVCSDGEYVVLELNEPLFMNDRLKEDCVDALSKCLKDFIKKYRVKKSDCILVAGVGNEGMTADALGAKTLKYLEVTEHFYRDNVLPGGKGRLSCIAGSVSGVTGLKSFDIIKGVCDRIKPSLIIAVDTLASRKTSRLQRVIQIGDRGLTPGSGVNNAKITLDELNLGVPVIAIGVPLVIYAKNIIHDFFEESGFGFPAGADTKRYSSKFNELVVTVKEIDVTVEDFACVIGQAINRAIHN